jgi:AcrR family transcriptional regulator
MDRIDARKQRTRQALLAAFFRLVLERRYHELRISHILQASGVGRSTFYEHFRSKDELLAASLEGPFSILANTAVAPALPALTALLEHFWQNRAMARGILSGAVRRRAVRVLVELIVQRLRPVHGDHLRAPPRLTAIALAEMQLAPITAWLAGEESCSAATLAASIQQAVSGAMQNLSAHTTAVPAPLSLEQA